MILSPAWRLACLSQDVVDNMRNTYKNDDPLRGWELEEDDGHSGGTGTGFDTRGTESKRALGRSSKSDNPLAHVFAMWAQGIIRAEKNRFLRPLTASPNKNLWDVNRREKIKRLNTQIIKKIWQQPSRIADSVLMVKVGVDEVYITTHDPHLAMKNLDAQSMDTFMRVPAKVTRITVELNMSLTSIGSSPTSCATSRPPIFRLATRAHRSRSRMRSARRRPRPESLDRARACSATAATRPEEGASRARSRRPPRPRAEAVTPSLRAVSTTAATGQPANQYADYKSAQDAMTGIGAGLSSLPEAIEWEIGSWIGLCRSGAAYNNVMDAVARESGMTGCSSGPFHRRTAIADRTWPHSVRQSE